MRLTSESLKDRKLWEEAGFSLPQFDVEAMKKTTIEKPTWIHFGAGNIFRAFPANVQQNILNAGKANTGIIVAEGFDYEIIEKMYKPNDNLSVLVTLKADGTIAKTVVASIAESLTVNPENEEEWNRLKDIFSAPSLQMVSFTITEKGYNLYNSNGSFLDLVAADFNNGPKEPVSYIGKIAALLYQRYQAGKYGLSLVSMDNCSHNGTKLYEAVVAYAKAWVEKGLVEEGFLTYINDPNLIAFPWSMIDKITPRPDDSVKEMLKKSGFNDVDSIVTSKNTYVAPFVNAEEAQYLVIEDAFPNGRPNLDESGVIFTDKETVDKVEKMKVCTCLNPLHTALAIFGCLLDYTLIADEMKDLELKKLVEIIGYQEGLPVVVDPGIIRPKDFIDEVLKQRIPNPFIPDTPQRIATDTSQKLGIRFGETIKAYQKSEHLNVSDLKLIPLTLAAWCRYLMAIDDNGKKFTPSSDPMLENVMPYLKGIEPGSKIDFHEKLQPILSNEKIFGVNLYEVGLGEKVEAYFAELVSGPGAVRNTLKKYTE
ncbi:mannitol dehydrogenase family protein [Clostridium sp. Marseille-P299]|uniref:mannitol dehydrogenase family protein n=1 Tax=Clostridium sp. Marseille-P299 TaxID=1805477 RepID=UPI00082E0168|nr:mannitol dehydrogenase family protein [Clostridium sp. Marseille-P299]